MRLRSFARTCALSSLVVLATVMGNATGTSGDPLTAEPSFGKPVGGLAVAVQLDRSTIRPGKRLEAHVLLRNVTDKPIRVVPSLLGWEITADGKSRGLPPAEKASPWQPDPATALTVPPHQTVLLMSRKLEGVFDLATDGQCSVQYKLSLTREQLGKGAAADELWTSIVKAGVWTGACDAPPARLTVDPKVPVAGRLRTTSLKVVAADKSGVWIDALEGDSSIYPGQVVETGKGGRLRVAHQVESGRWLLTSVPPLKAESVRVGDKLNVEEEDYHWMLSAKAPAKGQPMGGLTLVLEMDKNKLAAGEAWTGKLRLLNKGKEPVHISLMGQLLTNLHTTMGDPPGIVACIGRGIGPDRKEIDDSRKVIQPGKSLVLLHLDKPESGELSGTIGNNFVAWKVAPGRYELSFKYWMSLESVAGYELKPVFTGIVHSNVVEIEVGK